jgi:autophagy-related protein 9
MANMTFYHKSVLWLFAMFWFLKLFQHLRDVRSLMDLRDFYFYLLGISDKEMQTISWQHVVRRVMDIKEHNLATASRGSRIRERLKSRTKLDPHGIANRIMRKENYLIAMINKDILDLSIPLPFFRSTQFLTENLMWNIDLCIMDFVFNSEGRVRPVFLKEYNRELLSQGLKRRFLFMGFMNIVCAPYWVIVGTLRYFFRYFDEFHRNPSSIGTREYTPLAEWKMRELNELDHLFKQRLNISYPAALRYINQFPREKTISLLKFVAFVTGSFAAVLGIISLIDPELFLGFEITNDRTVLFYIGVFGSISALSRSMIPDEPLVFDPETSMRYVAEFTHYLPKEWEGKLHSDMVSYEMFKVGLPSYGQLRGGGSPRRSSLRSDTGMS